MNRVLIVDDDGGIRRLAGYVLSSAGFDVATAANGQEGLNLLDTEKPDVVVLDLNMPLVDGYTFVHEADRSGNRPRILILSSGQAEKAQRELGVDSCLQKPFRPDELVSKVQALSAGPGLEA